MEQSRVSLELSKNTGYLAIAKKLLGFIALCLFFTAGAATATENTNNSQQQGNFVPYYPKGCSITAHTCLCVQDLSKYKDVWYTKANNTKMSWIDADGWATGLNINAANPNGTCGIKNGWGLPHSNQMKYLLNNTSNSINQKGFTHIQSDLSYWGGTCHLKPCTRQDVHAHTFTYNSTFQHAYFYHFTPSNSGFTLKTKTSVGDVGGAISVVATSGNN